MYYETFLMENETKPTLDVLGQAYVNEEKMRFLMGLIFVLHKVNFIIVIKILKQTIFKWEKVSNELAPWAQKYCGCLFRT